MSTSVNFVRIALTLTIPLLAMSLGSSPLCAADLSTYRGFHFGMDPASAAALIGAKPSDVRIVYQQPAVIQELDWQPRGAVGTKSDTVKTGLLSFYDNQLFRIVITYDRYKVEGMSADDLIEAVSTTYGPAANPKGEIALHSNYGETAPVLARWEDTEYAYNLVQSGDKMTFAMVIYSKRLDALAEASIVTAIRQEALEAPQRAIDHQKQRDEEDRLALEKARGLNKANFHL